MYVFIYYDNVDNYTLKNVLLPQHTNMNKPEPETTEANYWL